MTQFTLTHHMVNKPFLLLGLAAEYRPRRRRRWCDKHCDRPSDVYDTDRRSKLTALETISRWLLLKRRKWHLGVTYALHLWLVGKPVVDFIFVVIELFFAISYGWDVMSENRSKSAFFEGVGHFERRFQREGASPTSYAWYQSSRVIAVSCGIKISAVRHLVLSHCTRVADGQTDGLTDGQNYDSQDRPRICSRGKNRSSTDIGFTIQHTCL